MKKRTLIALGLLSIICVVSLLLLSLYQALPYLQAKNVRALGWENDHYLWTIGMFGNVRWDVNQQIAVNRTFKPDRINQIFVSQQGEVFGLDKGAHYRGLP